jgi:ketosteroid isomerase-like protein
VSQERVAKVLRGYELFNRGEIEEALAGFRDDIEWVVPDMVPEPGSYIGRDGVRRFWDMWRETFHDFTIEIVEIHDLDDHVVFSTRVTGKGRHSEVEVTTPRFPQVWTFSGDDIVRMEMFQSEVAVREAIGKDWR